MKFCTPQDSVVDYIMLCVAPGVLGIFISVFFMILIVGLIYLLFKPDSLDDDCECSDKEK